MSAGKAFFDTNILLYIYGPACEKRERAADLFYRCAAAGGLLLSTQVIQEFYAAGGRKLKIPSADLRKATQALLRQPLVSVGPPHILAAIEIEERYRLSFWDALILAAAESGGAGVLYTEDLNHGQQYGSVAVRNPFHA
jgi:predicted nucleic acid-binding protein